MDYREFLSSEPVEGDTFPYNTIEFFDDEKMLDAFYLNHKKLAGSPEDEITPIVDDYLNEHPEVTRAVAYRIESHDRHYAYREYGRD